MLQWFLLTMLKKMQMNSRCDLFFNAAMNDFDVKKFSHCNLVLVLFDLDT